ncbi:MAG: hypothetical protein ACJ8C4_09100 [Gemmataceae bacterium]
MSKSPDDLDAFVRGRTVLLSPARRFICDLMHFAKKVPSIPMQRRMALGELVAARRTWPRRLTWRCIFAKAMAILSERRPELRRAYMKSPFPRLYEHPFVIANIAFEREYRGDTCVFIGRVPLPQRLSLADLDRRISEFQTNPVRDIPEFRTHLFLSRWPWPVRRLVWWVGLNVSGLYRSWFYGTFAISVVAALGSSSLHPLSPLTTILNYSPFANDGSLDVRLVYDHRVFDGAMTARFLSELEQILCNEILAELRAGPPSEEVVQSAVAAS